MLLLILTLLILLPVAIIWWYQNFSRIAKHVNKIHGPGIPIMGSFLDFVFTDMEKIFIKDRERCAKYPTIFKMWIFHKVSVVIQNPEDIEILLSSTKHIKKSQLYDMLHIWLRTGLLTSDGDKWKMRRKMLTPAFHFTILKGFVDVFNKATIELTNMFETQLKEDLIDVIPHITEFTLQSMAETSMGTSLNLKDQVCQNYKKAIADFSEIGVYRLSRPWFFDDKVFRFTLKSFEADKCVKTLHNFTRNIIKQKKLAVNTSYTFAKRLAMLDLLLKAQELDGSIDDDGIYEEVDTFMFEGHDTTSVAICHILLVLANHQKIQNEIRQEIIDIIGDSDQLPTYNDLQELAYTERCIKECLRLFPSVLLIGRNIEEDIETATGYTIPKGSMAHIFIFDLHRNPELYPNPLKFDPDRFLPEHISKRHPFAYIPFSAGSRNCIGQKFAMLELKAVLCGLLRKFVLEPIDTLEDIVFKADMVLRSKNPIRIRFLKRD